MVMADYPFFDVFWTLVVVFLWITWFWLLISVFGDLIRRRDASGWKKAAWMVFTIVFPFLGVFSYLILNSEGMAERRLRTIEAQQSELEAHLKNVARGGGAASEIHKAKELLDAGAITAEEFDALKAKVLASA